MLTFWVGLCLASGLVINGQVMDEDAVKGLQLTGVDVMIDANGTIHITAPNVQPTAEMEKPAPQPAAAQPPPVVPTNGWWLVAQDMGSVGHDVEVAVNDTVVASFRSGQAAQPVHLGEILQPGDNLVRLRSTSVGASGGMFYVFVAQGEISNAEMRLETPVVQFGLGASREGAYERTYTVNYTP